MSEDNKEEETPKTTTVDDEEHPKTLNELIHEQHDDEKDEISNKNRIFKVLITGFGPFGDVETNPSWEAVSKLWDSELESNIKLITRELPVSYEIVQKEVDKLWTEETPDVSVLLFIKKKLIFF
jgi:hypothetical protein